jgi:uncharacterized membrane protein YgcG
MATMTIKETMTTMVVKAQTDLIVRKDLMVRRDRKATTMMVPALRASKGKGGSKGSRGDDDGSSSEGKGGSSSKGELRQ